MIVIIIFESHSFVIFTLVTIFKWDLSFLGKGFFAIASERWSLILSVCQVYIVLSYRLLLSSILLNLWLDTSSWRRTLPIRTNHLLCFQFLLFSSLPYFLIPFFAEIQFF